MFSFEIKDCTAHLSMRCMMNKRHHPRYAKLSISTLQYSEDHHEVVYDFIYKDKPFKWLSHLVPDRIYNELVSIRNQASFLLSQKSIQFRIQPQSGKHYEVNGRVRFLETGTGSVIACAELDKMVFRGLLKRLPDVILKEIEDYVHVQVKEDLRLLVQP